MKRPFVSKTLVHKHKRQQHQQEKKWSDFGMTLPFGRDTQRSTTRCDAFWDVMVTSDGFPKQEIGLELSSRRSCEWKQELSDSSYIIQLKESQTTTWTGLTAKVVLQRVFADFDPCLMSLFDSRRATCVCQSAPTHPNVCVDAHCVSHKMDALFVNQHKSKNQKRQTCGASFFSFRFYLTSTTTTNFFFHDQKKKSRLFVSMRQGSALQTHTSIKHF